MVTDADDRDALEARWLDLTRGTLPALAEERGWPVRFDHCFQRIILDAVFGGTWYDHVPARPAYRALELGDLKAAVRLAEDVAAGRRNLPEMNERSLAWRRAWKQEAA